MAKGQDQDLLPDSTATSRATLSVVAWRRMGRIGPSSDQERSLQLRRADMRLQFGAVNFGRRHRTIVRNRLLMSLFATSLHMAFG
jgi:hypothetical protein